MPSVSRFSEANAKTIVIPMDNLLTFETSASAGNAGVSPAKQCPIPLSETHLPTSYHLQSLVRYWECGSLARSNNVQYRFYIIGELNEFNERLACSPLAKLPVLGAFLSPDNGGQRGIGALIATTEGLSS